MPVYRWSETAANNGTADPTCVFPEGMSPSAVNDGIRGAMAAVRMYADDVAGAIVTGGTSTIYTLASSSVFASLAFLDKQMLAFVPHVTNGAGPVTLNVDGLGAKALRSAPNVEIPAGVLIQGTPYCVTYSNTDGCFYLQGFFGNPYQVPIGGMLPYVGTTAPNSSFVFPFGQAISRTTYATLFSLTGTTFGVGDGSTTFGLPDFRGRVPAGVDNMGGSGAGRLTTASGGLDGTTLGAASSSATHTLTTNEIPSHYHVAGIYDPQHAHSFNAPTIAGGNNNNGGGGGSFAAMNSAVGGYNTASAATGVRVNSSNGLDTTYSAGGGAAHSIVQPTMAVNFLLRIF